MACKQALERSGFGTVLYISAAIAPQHAMHAAFRRLEPPPDLDLRRITAREPWLRGCFATRVVDATQERLDSALILNGIRGVVIGGSIHSVAGTLAPWQERLVDFLREVVYDHGLPFLGLCGGAQLGLVALGGRVRPNPDLRGRKRMPSGSLLIQRTEIALTQRGRDDPLFEGCPPMVPMLESHRDWLAELPVGTEVLGNSSLLSNQIVAWGASVRLVQPHPELDDIYLRRLLRTMSYDSPEGKEIREAAKHLGPTPVANQRIVSNFLEHFCGVSLTPRVVAPDR